MVLARQGGAIASLAGAAVQWTRTGDAVKSAPKSTNF
jgi:hypothetical protein